MRDLPTPTPSRSREGDETAPLPPAGGAGGGQATFKLRNAARAKELRNEASPPERLLWQKLRNRQLDGHKCSRQIPIGPFFADFLCREQKLVVELDGASHDARQNKDAERDTFIEAQGYRVLRVLNGDLSGNPEGVLISISQALNTHPQPLPQAGGGKTSQ